MSDYTNKRLSTNLVKSKTRTTKTPDGRHFVAFQQIHGSKYRRISRKLIAELKRTGIIKRSSDLRPSSARMLSRVKQEKLSKMLNFRMD